MRPPSLAELDRGFPGGKIGSAKRWTPREVLRAGLDIHRGVAWAIGAEASSQWGTHGSWWAKQCVGRPDVWPKHGDRTGAWAPADVDGRAAWIEVRFDPCPPATAIRIFETNGAGAAYALALDRGEGWEVVWLARPTDAAKTACMLEVELPEPRRVTRARVWVDCTQQDSWAEIDTVALRCQAEVAEPLAPPVRVPEPPVDARGRGRRYTAREMKRVDDAASSRGLWPVAARASSEFSSSWAAGCLVGRPRVWPGYGDRRGAWAPRGSRSGVEWIEVDFASGDVPTRAIRIFETNVAGSTIRVARVDRGEEHVLWEAPAENPRRAEACVLEVELEELTFVRRLRVYVDNSAGGWSEIDSVSILPVPRGDPYRGLAPGRGLARASSEWDLHERLMAGFDGARVGDGRRFGVFEMFAHDWQVGWRGVWPVSATASSSYGGAWSADRATGKPGIYPLSGDLPGNWAPHRARGGVEWLDVDFGRDVDAAGIRVFETCNPGAVFALVAFGTEEALVWADAPVVGGGADVLEVRFAEPRSVRRVRAYLDNSIAPGWAEIDTIGLLRAAP